MYDMSSLPITELSNEFSGALGGSTSAEEFLRTLRAADAQIFSGWRHFSSLFDDAILQQCENVAQSCASLLCLAAAGRDVAIVMTGCGTSGRIAFLTARRFNNILKLVGISKPAFYYLISGGDSALFLSDELPEDDPIEGVSDLDCIISQFGKDGSFLIGVTCGLSAPYVAGQLEVIMRRNKAHVWSERTGSTNDGDDTKVHRGAAVLGFNPLTMARNVPIAKAEGCWTFRDVAMELEDLRMREQESSRAPAGCTYATLTPVIGPEPIAGSSRMKGGSATAIILDGVCRRAVDLMLADMNFLNVKQQSIEEIFLDYQRCHAVTYSTAFRPPCPLPTPSKENLTEPSLCRVMDCAGLALRSNCALYVVGSDSGGCVGFIDVSEMPDTYGSPFDQVRGFVSGGWEAVQNREGDFSHVSKLHRISTDHFRTDILPSLQDNDAVVFVLGNKVASADLATLATEIYAQGKAQICLVAAMSMDRSSQLHESVIRLAAKTDGRYVVAALGDTAHDGIIDFSLKLMLNAVSTYAQASGRGAVYKGLMVSTGPANDKIYARCVRLLAESFPGVSLQHAEYALIKAIHGVDELSPELIAAPTHYHIQASVLPPDQRHCAQIALPLAMLLLASDISPDGTGEKWTIASGRQALTNEPRIGILLKHVFETQSPSIAPQSRIAPGRAVVFDLGGTHIRGACAEGGRVVGEVLCRRIGDDRTVDYVVALIGQLYSSLTQGFNPTCIVLAQPGCVDNVNGTISALANYSWEGLVPIRVLLRKVTQVGENVPIVLMDDANAALLGEMQAQQLCQTDTVCMITIGTGIGTSVSIGGHVLQGRRGLIEGGHHIVCPSGRHCACGQRGCLEVYSSGSAIAAIAAERGVVYGEMRTCAEDVVSAAANGLMSAQETLSDAARYLALGCINMVRLYDPKAIVIGGGLSSVLLDDIKRHYKVEAWGLHDDLAEIDIVEAKCSEPGIVGAAVFAARGSL